MDTDLGDVVEPSGLRELQPPRRVVLLGASNLVRSLPIVLDTARNAWGSPLDILAAMGHGRSYNLESRVLGRALPGILQCGIWQALAARSPASTAALITDLGNDILYGASATQIARWAKECLERLRPVCCRITLTRLPIESVEKLGAGRFLLMRTILFPKSRLTLAGAVDTARELDERVVELAAQYDADVCRPERNWYGFDPIHIKRSYKLAAWQQLFAAWCDDDLPPAARHSLASWLRVQRLRPERRRLFGIEQQQVQPARQLADGSLVSLY